MELIAGFLATFFIFGSFWFWILGVVAFGALVALADNEQNFWAGTVTTVFIVGTMYFNHLAVDWSTLLWVILGYLVIGVAMSFVKWILYLKRRAYKYVDLKLEFYAKNKNEYKDPSLVQITKTTNMREVLNEERYAHFMKFLGREGFILNSERRIIPQWQDKKGKLVSWALWWPAVIFWAFLNDFIKGTFEAVVRELRSKYEAIAAKVFGNVGVNSDDGEEDSYSKY